MKDYPKTIKTDSEFAESIKTIVREFEGIMLLYPSYTKIQEYNRNSIIELNSFDLRTLRSSSYFYYSRFSITEGDRRGSNILLDIDLHTNYKGRVHSLSTKIIREFKQAEDRNYHFTFIEELSPLLKKLLKN